MTEETAGQFLERFNAKLNYPDKTTLQATIHIIWMTGACERLANIGILHNLSFTQINGYEEWGNIDRLRFELLPPRALSFALVPFTKAAAVEELREELARAIACYYDDSSRMQLSIKSFERMFRRN